MRKAQQYLNSGEIHSAHIGGTTANHEVVTRADLITSKCELYNEGGYSVNLSPNIEEPIEFDEIVINRGAVSGNTSSNSILISSSAAYVIDYGVDVGFDNNDTITIDINVNGDFLPKSEVSVEGRGANKPMPLYWSRTVYLVAGDIVKLEMYSDENTHVNVEKAILRISEDR